jgi:hypothetical protein
MSLSSRIEKHRLVHLREFISKNSGTKMWRKMEQWYKYAAKNGKVVQTE